jgi:hypothetical protein
LVQTAIPCPYLQFWLLFNFGAPLKIAGMVSH